MRSSQEVAAGNEAGFTLIEVLLATLLMTVILGALVTVTAQWLPNWNRGIAQVQRAERLALGLNRILADLSVAEMVPLNGEAKTPLFEGAELSVTFVRTAVGPNMRPGLEVVRFLEKADQQGLAMVRERAPFAPLREDEQLRFADQVVLVRSPYRVSFSYAGPDQVWQRTWRGLGRLPDTIRVTVRDAATARVLAVSSAAIVRVNAPADCARARDPKFCLSELSNPGKPGREAPL
ncbi:PulJ/GspJ family protein [Bradyrhizobium prioriisuperbiae]|uniref:PulJ/GspJ family protein n=1 Tax=Bradyrhizobium prioriisuperbiae TaxID=2854389 RepID=UPI0028E3D252|nr:prepilin-type N-terminal cleavage/methylation domain-containing protein [Bradyrhizobium prioritasuperba]